MALAKRVIACLDVSHGRVVKGVNFTGLVDAGDPVELSRCYGKEGIDELVFLDVSATVEDRGMIIDVVKRTADEIFIPLTVGGGIRSSADVDVLLRSGADKVSINTAAVRNPELISSLCKIFGSQCIVLSLDVRRTTNQQCPSGFEVTTHGGRNGTGIDALWWMTKAADDGAGEILLNSIDADGTGNGFDVELISLARRYVSIPLIASGGAGELHHFSPALAAGADAVLAAGVFHFGKLTIPEVKQELANAGHCVRL